MEAGRSSGIAAAYTVKSPNLQGLNRCSCLVSTPTKKFGTLKAARNLNSSRLWRSRVATEEQGSVESVEEKDLQVEESVLVLKAAAKSKKIPAAEVFSAFRVLEKARIDPSNFLEIIGGCGTPRCWMLVFTTGAQVVREALKGGPGGGTYFPFTAVQQFNATTKSIQNGVYLGPLGALEFSGRFSWSNNKLFFLFDAISLRLGPLSPLKFSIASKQDQQRDPGKKDPFFIWFFADDEIIVGKGRGGGIALWVRCSRVGS